MYKIKLKDSTIFNLKEIVEDTDKGMRIILDTELSHDEAVSKFTEDNLQYVEILLDYKVINSFVNFDKVIESCVKNNDISIYIQKSSTKDIIINLRKEKEDLKQTIETCEKTIDECNESLMELYDVVITASMKL